MPKRIGAGLRTLAMLAAAAIVIGVSTFLAVLGYSEVHARHIEAPASAPLVVVLGFGVTNEGVLHPRSASALRRALGLYSGGQAERLHFSGGAFGRVPEARAMLDIALEHGVEAQAITIETRSSSTLQNALFTLQEIGTPPPGTVIIADRAHLPRAWLTFWWAGVREHTVLAAEPWPRERREDRMRIIARETLAIWYNVGRMIGASARIALGADRADIAAQLGRQPIGWGPPT